MPGVYVVRPQAASEADLTLAATTQAIKTRLSIADERLSPKATRTSAIG